MFYLWKQKTVPIMFEIPPDLQRSCLLEHTNYYMDTV